MKNTELEKIKAAIYQKNLTYDELVNEAAFWQDWAGTLELAYEDMDTMAEKCESLMEELQSTLDNLETVKSLESLIHKYEVVRVSLEGQIKGRNQERINRAKNAASARHSKPGGSHEKQQTIREIWATGKYTSRDICAEEECASLGMSFSAARKALRNTPNPIKPSRC